MFMAHYNEERPYTSFMRFSYAKLGCNLIILHSYLWVLGYGMQQKHLLDKHLKPVNNLEYQTS